MRTRNSYFLNNSSVTIPRRRNKRRTPNIVEPELRTIVQVAPMADNRTMEELLQAHTEGYEEAIVIPKINADHFEIKTNLLQLVQANPYHGFERENPHTHINNFKRITSTLKFTDVPNDKVVTPALVKAVEKSCVTCGGAHAYYNCPNTDRNQPSVCVATGTYNQVAPQNHVSNYMAPPGFALNQASTSDTLPSNTIPNPKDEMKAITTRSGVAYEGPSIPTPKKVVKRETEETTDKEQTNFQRSAAHIQPLDKLFGLAKMPLNENFSAMLLKKLFENLGDPGKFLIPCDFSGMETDFVVVDFEADPRVPLILRRPFLWIGRALIDVYREEITLWVNDEAVTFNLYQTTRYSSTYDDLLVNRINIIDVAREEYAQEILGFSNNSSGGNPTSTSEHILSNSSPSLTPFEGSDFILEEIEAYLKDERAQNIVEPELRTIVEVAPMADNQTMEELLQAPTKGYGEAIAIPEINADHFEIKTNLLQLVQANPYHGFERENPHTHINNLKRITLNLKFKDVSNDVIKLMMFPYSLEGAARVWENASKTDDRIDKLGDQISTLVDIVSKKVVTPALVKVVEESCVTCGGNHAYYNCDATNSNQSSVCVATGTYN
nr:reverse transcriptase domain-containing protein [Tanacetum cinerariifolium]